MRTAKTRAWESCRPVTPILHIWLVKLYPNRGHLINAARSVVETAFGMLKGRWRLLLKKVEQQTRTLSKTVLAALMCFT